MNLAKLPRQTLGKRMIAGIQQLEAFFPGLSWDSDVRLSRAMDTQLPADPRLVRTFPAVLGYGAGLAVLMSTYDYTGGSLKGYGRDPEIDEFERKECIRKNKRRPIQETLEQLGEGRGGQHQLERAKLLTHTNNRYRHIWT